ncbi:unnamed protein product [Paramecium sonneborni]|uniref:Transmembrane protein n=1 Tax=Paramecium sonneborni TaxID=65129 RepID=A0A8S1KP61_9CILI|nr:unnamed protein product [Paramecium sonneborni]
MKTKIKFSVLPQTVVPTFDRYHFKFQNIIIIFLNTLFSSTLYVNIKIINYLHLYPHQCNISKLKINKSQQYQIITLSFIQKSIYAKIINQNFNVVIKVEKTEISYFNNNKIKEIFSFLKVIQIEILKKKKEFHVYSKVIQQELEKGMRIMIFIGQNLMYYQRKGRNFLVRMCLHYSLLNDRNSSINSQIVLAF